MTDYIFGAGVAAAQITTSDGLSFSNGFYYPPLPLPPGYTPVTFTITGPKYTMTVTDNDGTLEDNTNAPPGQTLDTSQQTLAANFLDNEAGDYVWSRWYQPIVDDEGNAGRIYQVRASDWNHVTGGPEGAGDHHTYYFLTGDVKIGPGTVYSVAGRMFGDGNVPYANMHPVCFARGTRIRTERGEVAVEDLAPGDMIETLDHGPQPLRWIGARRYSAGEVAAHASLTPVCVRAGAIAEGSPANDLVLSPQHRMLVSSKLVDRMTGHQDALIAVKKLVGIDGIAFGEHGAEGIEYFHLLMDRHELIWAEGALAETLYTGDQALRALSPEALDEVTTLFPHILQHAQNDALAPARPFLTGHTARRYAQRAGRRGAL